MSTVGRDSRRVLLVALGVVLALVSASALVWGPGVFDGGAPQNATTPAPGSDGDTAPNATDADSGFDQDGLDTGFERELGLDPNRSDSDGDGTPDPREDFDADGLPALAELRNGTTVSDPDTDDDGLEDGGELAVGTDLLAPDSDGDGTDDGNETYTTTARAESLGATVSVTGEGHVAGAVSITEGPGGRLGSDPIDGARVSPLVRIEAGRPFANATVRLRYDDSGVDESDLAIATFDEERGRWVRLNSTLAAGENAVVARTSHFSTFVVLNWPAFVEKLRSKTPSRKTVYSVSNDFESGTVRWFVDRRDPTVVNRGFGDQSNALETEFNGQFTPVLGINASNFTLRGRLSEPIPHTAVSVAGTRGNDVVRITLQTMYGAGPYEPPHDWKFQVTGGGDVAGKGARFDHEELRENRWYEFEIQGKVIDGTRTFRAKTWPAGEPEPDGWEREFVVSGTAFTDGRLKFRRTETAGVARLDYYNVTTYAVPPDLDGDGVPTGVERTGALTGTGDVLVTNATDPDTDDDGLEDGTELGEYVSDPVGEFPAYYRIESDPTDPNTDDVGLNDSAEVARGSDPLTPESLAAWFEVPTIAEGEDDPTPKPAGDDGRLELQPAITYSPGTVNENNEEGRDAWPGWYRRAVEAGGTVADDRRALLVDVPVIVAAGNVSSESVPTAVDFEIAGHGRVVAQGYRQRPREHGSQWYGPRESVPIDEGGTVVSLVISAPKRSKYTYVPVGQFRMNLYTSRDSVFTRDRDDPRGGLEVASVTTSATYTYRYWAIDDIRHLGGQSIDRVKKAAISTVTTAVGPTSAYAKGAIAYGVIVKGSTKAFAAGTAFLAANAVRTTATEFTAPGTIEALEGYEARRINTGEVTTIVKKPPIINDFVDDGKKFYVTRTGAIIIRRN